MSCRAISSRSARVVHTELDGVSGVIDELWAGRLTWSREAIAEDVEEFPPLE